jgi:hypothetical protein
MDTPSLPELSKKTMKKVQYISKLWSMKWFNLNAELLVLAEDLVDPPLDP